MIKQLNSPQHNLSLLNHSNELAAKIKHEIDRHGPINFARFMELALYAPGLGYYAAGLSKIGKAGDFSTAPEISSLYSKCLAKQCYQVLQSCKGDILEFGAGTGKMACDILLELERMQCLPRNYFILEVSADLKERQKIHITSHAPHLIDRVIWIESLADFKLEGIILANEVIDAFPVRRFKMEDGLKEFYVGVKKEEFAIELKTPTQELQNYIEDLQIEFAEGYESECNLLIQPWISSLSESLFKGVILLIDYGFPRHEYYHEDRNRGTLMCHYQHQTHTDPLTLVGLQDITAHVDFTAVAEAALHANLEVTGFTNQASFLLACGIIDELQKESEEKYSKLANEVKVLTSINEMGELFKVMALSKNVDLPLQGFSLRNMCERL